jgi:hypothetical protein
MYSYCVEELHMDEDLALERIEVGHAAREFPAIFEMLSDGRLNPASVIQMAPYLKPENVDELLAAAEGKTGREIEQWLSERFA